MTPTQKLILVLLLMLGFETGCVSIPPAPPKGTLSDFAQRFPPMPPVANNATTQQSLIVQSVPLVATMPVQPSQFTNALAFDLSTNLCRWEAIQGSDDGMTWTNERVFLSAGDLSNNVFTNSTQRHFWRYVHNP